MCGCNRAEAPFQVFQHPNVITYVGIATHIGRGCESWNPARHIVVPWKKWSWGNCPGRAEAAPLNIIYAQFLGAC